MRTLFLLMTAAVLLGNASAQAAQNWGADAYGRPLPQQATQRYNRAAQPRTFDGSGYRGLGSATGGPAGGLPNRN